MIRTTLTLAVFWLCHAALAQTTPIPSPGSGQPGGGVPVIPVANPQAAFAKLPVNLQNHLAAWEKKTSSLKTFYTECEREVKNTLKQKTVNYTGAIRCMKPNLAYLRIDNTNPAKKDDFAAYICDGKDVFEYSGAEKTMRQHPIPPGGKGNVGDNLLLEFMSGAMTAADIAQRFQVKLIQEDKNYIYIDVKPALAKDQQEFDSLILVLFNSGVNGWDYLPAKVRMTRDDNREVEEWTFKKPMADPQGIKKEDFKYVEPPKDWQKKLAGPQPKVTRP
jgi:TIGR03009 family protein